MQTKIAAFRHVENEPLGYLGQVFLEHGVPVEYIDLFATNEVPRAIDATHLVFMGGPMSVNDEQELPWLVQEKALIRKSAKTGQKVLGICLGAQLIASAYGARVCPCPGETGWMAVSREPGAPGVLSRFPDRFSVFQIHGETFDIPYGGRLLARGSRVRNQALLCNNALGLQFHLEMTGGLITAWSKTLPPAKRAKIARDTPKFIAKSNRLCRMVAEDFIR